ncbi:MAG: hypothetical protein GY851_04215 [bacterium]|nr:hypothetical protein [bacterium]
MCEDPAFQKDGQNELDTPLCPSCLQSNPPTASFCEHCGCPISNIATHCPFGRTLTQGWLYRKIISGRPHPIALVGVWMILGPTALTVVLMPILAGSHGGDIANYLTGAIVSLTAALVLFKVTRNYFAAPDEATRNSENSV